MAQKTGMDRSAGDPDVWIGLDHLRFGMDHGVWIACGTGVWIGTLHFEPQPFNSLLLKMTIEIVDLPINNGDFPSFFCRRLPGRVVMFTNGWLPLGRPRLGRIGDRTSPCLNHP